MQNDLPENREIWKSISGYPNYEVSTFGRVRNVTSGLIKAIRVNRQTGYCIMDLYHKNKCKTWYLHKLVANEFLQDADKMIDHIDGNRANNLLSNLRVCSGSQNQGNRKKQKTKTTSKHKGVYYSNRDKRWLSRIAINKKKIHLGCFKTEDEAGIAYNNKAKELFGEFARLNVI